LCHAKACFSFGGIFVTAGGRIMLMSGTYLNAMV